MKVTAVAIAMLVVLGAFVWVMVDAAMPSNASLTRIRMTQLQKAIQSQAGHTGEAPARLADLRMPSGEPAPTEDYWKRPLGYDVSVDGAERSIRLSSLGKDGLPGGTHNRDLELRFTLPVIPPPVPASNPATIPSTQP